MFPCKIIYGKPHNRLVFDRRYLQKNLTRTRQELEQFVNRSPFDIMTIPGREQTLESQIERLLAPKDNEQAGKFTLHDVAAALRISPQTIQRRLAQHDTSFNTIKENWRREKALKMLQTTQFSIEEISERLGFAEARSFTRAFKNWTGLSPRKFRKMF
jgi:AraC-like DNA-binding protein